MKRLILTLALLLLPSLVFAQASVQGQAADAAAVAGNPVRVSGRDGAGNTQDIATDTSGELQVDVVSIVAGSNVDVGSLATAATVDTEVTGQTADFDLELATANMRLIHATCEESAATAAAARVVLRHGVVAAGSCTGGVISFIPLSGDQGIIIDYTARGLNVASGVCGDVTQGNVSCGIAYVIESAP